MLAASSTFAQLRTIGCVLFKRVRDFWKMMLRLTIIFKVHTFAGGMDVFPSCFPPLRISPGWERFKALQIRPPEAGREGGREGGSVWRCHRDWIRKPICTANSLLSWAENWARCFARSTAFQFCGHFISAGFGDVFQFLWNIIPELLLTLSSRLPHTDRSVFPCEEVGWCAFSNSVD